MVSWERTFCYWRTLRVPCSLENVRQNPYEKYIFILDLDFGVNSNRGMFSDWKVERIWVWLNFYLKKKKRTSIESIQNHHRSKSQVCVCWFVFFLYFWGKHIIGIASFIYFYRSKMLTLCCVWYDVVVFVVIFCQNMTETAEKELINFFEGIYTFRQKSEL